MALGAVIIVVAAVVISKRRSTSIAAGTPEAGAGAVGRPGPERRACHCRAPQRHGRRRVAGPRSDEDGKTAAETTKTT